MPRGNKNASLTNRAVADRYAISVYTEHIRPLREQGMTYTQVADKLNELKIPTAYKGGKWRASRIGEIIKRAEQLERDDDRPGQGRTDFIRLPADLVERARCGDRTAMTQLRDLLGISPKVWEALKFEMRATNERKAHDVSLAPLVQTQTERMLIECVHAQALRMAGKPAECLAILDRWLSVEEGNIFARADVQRRRSRPLFELGHTKESLESALEAVNLYQRIGWDGFDLFEAGLGDALWTLGQIYGLSGQHQKAVAAFRRALPEVDLSVAEDLHGYILGALAVDLSKIGTPSALAEARVDLAELRSKFFRKRSSRSTYHMARLDWLEGSLKWRTEKRNRHRAREMVRRGRDLLTELEVPLDAACCAADLELMWNPEHRHEAVTDLETWLDKARPILPSRLAGSFTAMVDALNSAGFHQFPQFQAAVRRFRAKIEESEQVLPSFV